MAADNTSARRITNKQNALRYARNHIYVFPSSGKTPLVPRFNKRDVDLTAQERDAAIEEFSEKHGKPPAHVGATCDQAAIKALWREHPDAVPSIATGPNHLVVVDADVKNNGPTLLDELWQANGGRPEAVFVNTSKSGGRHEVFADPNARFTNSAGKLGDYGCDVRGTGGQIVAPGSIREDGKTYGTASDMHRFLVAFVKKQLPELPPFLADLIGTKSEGAAKNDETVNDVSTREVIESIEQADWDSAETSFDPDVGEYDIAAFKSNNELFAKLYDSPSDDTSDNRFNMARLVLSRWPKMTAAELFVFFETWEGAGEWIESGKKAAGQYNNRDVAREWLKNQNLAPIGEPSRGTAFDAVEIDDDEYDKKIVEERKEALGLKTGPTGFARDMAHFVSPDYIIENMFTPGTLAAIHGPSNVGKTFAVIDMGDCVTHGRDWFDLHTDEGGVIYCYGEGAENMSNRIFAYRSRFPSSRPGMWMHDGIPNMGLSTKAALKALEKAVKEANVAYVDAGMKPTKIMFIDTWAKAVAGINENDTGEVQPILNALRALARKLRICIVLIHHSGKDTMLGLRGSSAMLADVDINLEIVGAKDFEKRKLGKLRPGHLAVISPKMREGKKDGFRQFKLDEVEIGTNKWGNPVTSVVAIPFLNTPSTGSALGPVDDDDEEPALTADELTPEQNRADRERRMADCEGLAQVVRTGVLRRTDERVMKVQTAADQFGKLGKYRDAKGTNFIRYFRTDWFAGDAEVDLPGGTLRLEEAARGKSTLLVFKLVKPAAD